jgi:hypothetical protein
MSSQYVIPESTATIEYPASKRKKIIDHKGTTEITGPKNNY